MLNKFIIAKKGLFYKPEGVFLLFSLPMTTLFDILTRPHTNAPAFQNTPFKPQNAGANRLSNPLKRHFFDVFFHKNRA
jgi:hypothetical protein